jgi:hypothetical protein
MTTTMATRPVTDAATPSARRPRRPLFHAAVVAAPALWVAVALVHPMGSEGTLYDGLHDRVPLWLTLHGAQLVLSIGLAAGLWTALKGLPGAAATLARAALPVYLVFFAAFDSVAGLATGLTIHHANSNTGAVREGAISTADYLMNAANLSPVNAVGSSAMIFAIAGTALALRSAGAPRATWGAVLAGLLGATHAGPAAAVGFAALAVGFHRLYGQAQRA